MNKPFQTGSRNIIETILVILLLLSLFLALYDVLKVFFTILTFALIFSVSFADVFEKLATLLKGRRKLAAVIYSIVLIGIIAFPLIYFLSVLREHVREAIAWVNQVKANGLPPLPSWIANLPFVGGDISAFWTQLQHSPKDVIANHEDKVKTTLHHLLNSGIGMLGTALQFIVGIIISAFFLSAGEKMLTPVKSAAQYLLGRRDGLSLLRATTQAIKGVSIGVIGTALIASVVSWIGLTIAGVKFALILSALIFFLVLIQLGPLLVWIPLVIWSAVDGYTGMTIFLIIYGIALLIIDALLKPILIARSGGKLPFLVLFLGVVGGLAAWGFTGMFKGAIILAIFYTVFNSWLEGKAKPVAGRRTVQ
ncbi:MAG: AI-2E family transporter [Puia sp.]|nr:AI-2E family transporter [Puia sp.]